jgi:tRNA(His) 5'-end guanylyltransferase
MFSNTKDPIGDRMKSFYEKPYKIRLPMRIPVIARIDGKAFHTYTKGLKRPFDNKFMWAMDCVATKLCKEIQGAKVAFVQSDEITILIHNYTKHTTSAWFDNYIQKMVSVAAGIASSTMTSISDKIFGEIRPAVFDARVFVLPEAEVNNNFLWRQQDCTRNSIQMVARSLFSHKECDKKDLSDLQDMIFDKGINWNDYSPYFKRGRCIIKEQYNYLVPPSCPEKYKYQEKTVRTKWVVDKNIPLFSKDPTYIEKHLVTEE